MPDGGGRRAGFMKPMIPILDINRYKSTTGIRHLLKLASAGNERRAEDCHALPIRIKCPSGGPRLYRISLVIGMSPRQQPPETKAHSKCHSYRMHPLAGPVVRAKSGPGGTAEISRWQAGTAGAATGSDAVHSLPWRGSGTWLSDAFQHPCRGAEEGIGLDRWLARSRGLATG